MVLCQGVGGGESFLSAFFSTLSETWVPLPVCGHLLPPHSPIHLPTSPRDLPCFLLVVLPQPQHPLPSSQW